MNTIVGGNWKNFDKTSLKPNMENHPTYKPLLFFNIINHGNDFVH